MRPVPLGCLGVKASEMWPRARPSGEFCVSVPLGGLCVCHFVGGALCVYLQSGLCVCFFGGRSICLSLQGGWKQ